MPRFGWEASDLSGNHFSGTDFSTTGEGNPPSSALIAALRRVPQQNLRSLTITRIDDPPFVIELTSGERNALLWSASGTRVPDLASATRKLQEAKPRS